MQPIPLRLKNASSLVANAGTVAAAEIAQLDMPASANPRPAATFGHAVVNAAKEASAPVSKALVLKQTQRARKRADDKVKNAHRIHAQIRHDLNALEQLCDFVEKGEDGIPGSLDAVIRASASIVREGITAGTLQKSIVTVWRDHIANARQKLTKDNEQLLKRWGPSARYRAAQAAYDRYLLCAKTTGDETYTKLADHFSSSLKHSVERARRERKK